MTEFFNAVTLVSFIVLALALYMGRRERLREAAEDSRSEGIGPATDSKYL